MKSIAFFNNKGRVGRTSLVYHLAVMYSEELGVSVVAADLDPQANLSAMFLDEERLEELWPDGGHPHTILGALAPILSGTGDVDEPHVEEINLNCGLVVGDLGLSRFEAKLAAAWSACLGGDEAAFRTQSAFHRTILKAAERQDADVVLIDVGPNLGAINRAAVIAADFVVFPIASDLFSLQGLRNVGPTLNDWRKGWKDRIDRRPADLAPPLPSAKITAGGYIVMRRAARVGRPMQEYERWIRRIPDVYRTEVLAEAGPAASSTEDDPRCLGTLKHYLSLILMAQEARKPMFHLRAADGALGGYIYAVRDCYEDFKNIAQSIAAKCGLITLPAS